MNEIEQRNLLNLAHKYRNICINIDQFTDMLSLENLAGVSVGFAPQVERKMLMVGNYGSLCLAKLWVAYYVPSMNVRISNENITSVKECEAMWSRSIPLEQASTDYVERILNLKALW